MALSNEGLLGDLEATLAFLRRAMAIRGPFVEGKIAEFRAVVEALAAMHSEWSERERCLRRSDD